MFMQKLFGLVMMLVLVVVVAVGAPNALAQQNWTTYYKPSEFSIDYPTINGTANITESNGTIYIEGPIVSMIISKSPISLIDPQEIAVIYKEGILKASPETVIAQDIFTSLYDGNIGHTFVTYHPKQQVISSQTLVEHGHQVYDISLGGVSDNSNINNFNHILDSIKFFD